MGPRHRTERGALTTKVVEERIAGTVEALSSTSCWRGALHSPSPSQTHAQNAERHSNGPSSLVCFDGACICRLVKLDTPVLAAESARVLAAYCRRLTGHRLELGPAGRQGEQPAPRLARIHEPRCRCQCPVPPAIVWSSGKLLQAYRSAACAFLIAAPHRRDMIGDRG